MAKSGPSGTRSRALSIGCSVFGWGVFILLFIGILILGYRIWYYSDKLRRGQIIDVPEFTPKLTAVGDAPAISSVYIEPDVVAGQDQPSLGNDLDPKLTIVEFGDFQCPFSKEASTVIRTIMAEAAGKVRFIYRDYPIESIHPLSFQASVAAECAREQRKFWLYHDKLYANQAALGLADLLRYGEEIGLDTNQFERCVVENRYKDLVEADMAVAKTIGVRGTPVFFFNGQRIEGLIPEDILRLLVTKMVQ